jgi:hypothetical protein
LAHEESERLAREALESRLAAERRAREEAERRAAEEHELRQREEAERRAQEEVDRIAREGAERRAADEAGQRARAEAEHKAREEAERKMREALEADLAAERKAREDAERRAQEEAEARARKDRDDAERAAREAAERMAQEQAEREARDEAARREREAREQRAREDAERAAAAEQATREQKEEAEQQTRAEATAKALADAQLRAVEEAESQAAEDAARDLESPAAPESLGSPDVPEPHAAPDPVTSAEAAAADVTSFFEVDLDALDARERELRAEEEEKLKLEAERHAREFAANDEAERGVRELAANDEAERAEAARLEREAEEADRRAAQEAEQAAREEERRRVEETERRRQEEEAQRLREEAIRRERAEAEQRMREEAERRDREEAAARAQAEAQRKAEQKLQKKREKEEQKARKRAAAEERARAREAAKAAAPPLARGATRKAKWKKPAAISAALVLVAAIALVHVVPWDSSSMARVAASTLGEQVKIGSVRAGLFPSPHFKLEGVVIGKEQDAKIVAVRAVPDLSSLFSARKVLSSLELDAVTADANVLRRLPTWVGAERTKSLRVTKVVLRDVKLDGGTIALPPFGGEVGFDAAGAFVQAVLRSKDGKLVVELRNKPEGVEAEFTGRAWKAPFGPNIEFDEITGKAIARGTELIVSDLTARLYGGTATGHVTLAWNSPWTLTGDFSANQLDLATTLKAFTSQFRATGRLAATGRYTAQSASLDRLLAEPMVEAGFRVERGEIENLDLTRALQYAAAGTAVRGGKTQFAELSGTVKFAGKSYQYRQLALSSGILVANGSTDMVPSGDLAGRLNVELAVKPNPIRALVAVSGKLSDPQLKASR